MAQLRRFDGRVTAHVDGVAASIASVIAASADRVVMSPAGTLMVHEAWAPTMGNAADLRAAADVLDKHSATIASVYAGKTGKPEGEIRDLMRAETWMNATEAVALGFADEVAKDDPQPVRASASGTTVLAYASRLAEVGRMAATLSRAQRADQGD